MIYLYFVFAFFLHSSSSLFSLVQFFCNCRLILDDREASTFAVFAKGVCLNQKSTFLGAKSKETNEAIDWNNLV